MSPSIAFGKYTLVARLSSGAVADIFRATTQTGDGRELDLVIKRIRPELTQEGRFAVQFAENARHMSLLNHENIAKVYEWGQHENALFIAMEYIQGTNLLSLMESHLQQQKRFPPTMALYVLAEVLSGLNYAHGMKDAFGNPQHVVHRDVSPGNILISAEGQVKLVDFGLARAAVEVQAARPEVLGGKYRSMAPEVLRGEEVTPKADLYSVGVLLYELLTGTSITAPENPQAAESVAHAILQRPASSIQPDVPSELDDLIRRATSPDPAARPDSAMAMRVEVMTFLNRWDRSVDAGSLAAYIVESLSSAAGQAGAAGQTGVAGEGGGRRRPGFAFGEATSHWFASGDEVERVNFESEPAPAPKKKPKGGFAAGSTVMAVEESGLGRGRHLQAWALVGGLLLLVGLVILMVVMSSGDEAAVASVQPDDELNAPAAGSYSGPVQIHSKPEQVVIFVDGDMMEVQGQPPRIMGLRAGTRRFRLVAPGYLPWEGDVELAADAPKVIEQELKERRGDITFRSKPTKAWIYLDGKKVGRTPKTFANLSAASAHKIILRARRHKPLRFEIQPSDWPERLDQAFVLEKTLDKVKRKRRSRRRR
ncbi:MAG: serine/threonine protein kinase [Deltaproteobacteria bacterium]|nr:serine/threonine protein kinase [Deltaproteobacteria bacterium]